MEVPTFGPTLTSSRAGSLRVSMPAWTMNRAEAHSEAVRAESVGFRRRILFRYDADSDLAPDVARAAGEAEDVGLIVEGLLRERSPRPASTRLFPRIDLRTGRLCGWGERHVDAAAMSMDRAAHGGGGVLGPAHAPFLPGGMDALDRLIANADQADGQGLFTPLRDTPPGWKGPVHLPEDPGPKAEEDVGEAEEEERSGEDVLDLLDLLAAPHPELDFVPPPPEEVEEEEASSSEPEEVTVPLPEARAKKPSAKPEEKFEAEQKFAVELDTRRRDPELAKKVPRMARSWPFRLDAWQEAAVAALEAGDSVFVSAHTSAGKTVVAEYAVALCRAHLTRSIYTSPIKALSNQKFRDFTQAFGDVGLITGDIQLNQDAGCLIMTTEILRSMLYRGSEVIRELEWVIFDEVHYINDSERGVVWEEVLIMLPAHVKIIMLSATAPNSLEFAEWVGRIKDRRISVIGTLKRPVPLQHFLYTGTDGKTKKNRFLLVDEAGKFLIDGYKKAVEAKKTKKELQQARGGGRGGGRGGRGGGHFGGRPSDKGVWTALLDHLKTEDLLPVVIFTFSRKRCDENAAMLSSTDLTTAVEKREIRGFFGRCMGRLKGSDRKLPQVTQMAELCSRGLAVHHSGILPILKETVELLFHQGFVKVLFATETFAMGVNMPARTVVFDSHEKHDGRQRRVLEPGEYVQMAGRAGRRGLDSTGTVILLTKFRDVPESSELHHMMLGKPSRLASQFRVTYSMVLNLLRVEELRVEEMLQRSFAESAALRSGHSRKQKLGELVAAIKAAPLPDCPLCMAQGSLAQLHGAARDFLLKRRRLWPRLMEGLAKSLSQGRVLLLDLPASGVANRPAILLKLGMGGKTLSCLVPTRPDESLSAEVEEDAEPSLEQISSCILGSLDVPAVSASPTSVLLSVPAIAVASVTAKQLKLNTAPILEDFERRRQPRFRNSSPDRCVGAAAKDLLKLAREWGKGEPFGRLEEGSVAGLEVEATADLADLRRLRERVSGEGWDCQHCLSLGEHLGLIHSAEALRAEHRRLAYLLSPENLALLPSYQRKLAVLKRLGYVDESNMVELKGKVACEVHQAAVVLTELLVENALSELSVGEVAAVLAATTAQLRADEGVELGERLGGLRSTVMRVAERVSRVEVECAVEDSDAAEELNWGLSELVEKWAEGVPFAQLMELSRAQEGTIVRCIQRLNEVAVDVRNAARLVGHPDLAQKMQDVSAAIKRDIVFAASLYTTQL